METAVSKLQHSLLCWDFCPLIFVLFCFISSLPLTQWLLPSPNLAELTPLSLAPGEDPNLFSSLARLSSGTLFTSVAAILVIFASMTRRVRNQPSSEDCFTEISCHSISGLPGVYQYLQDDLASCAEYFLNIIIHSPSNPVTWMVFLPPFQRWGHGGTGVGWGLSIITQVIMGWVCIWIQAVWVQRPCLKPYDNFFLF